MYMYIVCTRMYMYIYIVRTRMYMYKYMYITSVKCRCKAKQMKYLRESKKPKTANTVKIWHLTVTARFTPE